MSAPCLWRALIVFLSVMGVSSAGFADPLPGDVPAPRSSRTIDATSVLVSRSLPYGTTIGWDGSTVTLALDLYQPAADGTTTSRPAVVWLHEGGFYEGDKAGPVSTGMSQILAASGFVVASIDYRLRPDAINFGPGFLPASVDAQRDAETAVKWLRTHAPQLGIDPFRIGIAGYSSGAIASLQVAVNDPSNDRVSDVAAVAVLSGASYTPVTITRTTPPTLIVHGTRDTLVPFRDAASTCSAINAGLGSCQLLALPTDHFLTGYEATAAHALVTFLQAQLADGSSRARAG